MSTNWSSLTLTSKPVLTVSPTTSLSNPNDGADYGPATAGTSTSGIQEAINSISSAGNNLGGTIVLLPGTFVVNAQISVTSNNIKIVGGGGPYNYSQPSQGAALQDDRATQSAGANDFLFVHGTSSVSIQGFELQDVQIAPPTNAQPNIAAISLENCYFCRLVAFQVYGGTYGIGLKTLCCGGLFISDFYLVDATTAIVSVSETADLFLERGFIGSDITESPPIGLLIEDCPNGPIFVSAVDITGGGRPSPTLSECLRINANSKDCNFIWFNRTCFDQATTYGVHVESDTADQHVCLSVHFTDCLIDGVADGYGLYLSADVDEFVLRGCSIFENSVAGVYLNPTNPRPGGILLQGNTISHNGTTTSPGVGVILQADGIYRIEGNFVGDDNVWTGSYVQGWGVDANVAPASTSYWIITGNMFLKNTSGAVKNSTNITSNAIYSNNWPNTP